MGATSELIDTVFVMFLVQDGRRNILVDTGIIPPDEACAHHHPCAQTSEQQPVHALERVGVSPDDVDTVVLTHLHWDHAANVDLFPNAAVYVQRDELRYARDPLPVHRGAYDQTTVVDCADQPDTDPPYLSFRNTPSLIDGDINLTDHVTILATPGHSPGSQSVLVRTESHRILLPGDNVPLHLNLPGGQHSYFTPNPTHVDLRAYHRSMRRSFQLSDTIVPSHDPRVAEVPLLT